MDRLVIFGDSALSFSERLAAAAVEAAAVRTDLRVVAICDTALKKPLPRPLRALRGGIGVAVVGLFNPAMRTGLKGHRTANLYDLAGKYGIEVVVPPRRNINLGAFIEHLKREQRPTLALALGCRQIFRRELLEVFEMAVNCHDAILPADRGLNATAWSLYRGEPETGFTYHVMNEEIDAGPVLLQGSLKTEGSASSRELMEAKLRLACEYAPELLDMMAARIPGKPQVGRGTYFGAKEFRDVTAVGDLSELTWKDVRKRLRAFGFLRLAIDGKDYPVTTLEKAGKHGPPRGALTFRTSDGVHLRASRFFHLPLPLYRALKILGAV